MAGGTAGQADRAALYEPRPPVQRPRRVFAPAARELDARRWRRHGDRQQGALRDGRHRQDPGGGRICRAYREDYTALLFAQADSPEELRRNLAGLAGPLLLPESAAAEEEVRLNAVLSWLAVNPGWLLILDNVDTPNALPEVNRLINGPAHRRSCAADRAGSTVLHGRSRRSSSMC